jgi:hypothetical protein
MEVLVDVSPSVRASGDPCPTLIEDARQRSIARVAVLVFAAFQLFYMLITSGRVRTPDEYATLYTAESLILNGSTAVPQAVRVHNFYGRFDLYGQPQAAYPPGQAILCAPWYAFGKYVLSRMPGVPLGDQQFVNAFSTCLSSATFSALTIALFFLLLNRIGIPPRTSLFASVLLGLGTPIFAYSAWFFSEPLSAALFMGVALLLFGRREQPISMQTAALAGLILGLSTWVRPTNVLAVAVFAAAVLVDDKKPTFRVAVVLCAASAMGILTLLYRNMALYGSPFVFGYPAMVNGTKTGLTFDNSLGVGLYGFLLSPGKSVFIFAPPLILAATGLRRLLRLHRGVATLAILFPLVYLCFFAKYSSWEGGYCAGPRYLVPSIAIFCLGLGPALTRERSGKFAWPLLLLGSLVQCLTLATSFLEDQAPARGHYYDARWHYRLNYSLGGQAELFAKYLRNGQPHTLGLGWDRWFVFLHLAGVSAEALTLWGLCLLIGLGISLAGLVRKMRVVD